MDEMGMSGWWIGMMGCSLSILHTHVCLAKRWRAVLETLWTDTPRQEHNAGYTPRLARRLLAACLKALDGIASQEAGR